MRFSVVARACCLGSFFTLSSTITVASTSSLNFQGFTGLINVPSARALSRGDGVAQYSDLFNLRGEREHAENAIIGFGLLPDLEISGRIAWTDAHSNLYVAREGDVRDLSVNIKYSLPWVSSFVHEDFAIAVGVQDLGGEANFFDSEFVVASQSFSLPVLGEFDIHAGVGKSDISERFDGVFGGLEWTPFGPLSFLAEHDGEYANAGVSLRTPERWMPPGWQINLKAHLYSSADDDRRFWSLAFTAPIGGYDRDRGPSIESPSGESDSIEKRLQERDLTGELDAVGLLNVLADDGLEALQLSVDGDRLIVAYENRSYNHNELDALAIVLSRLAVLPGEWASWQVYMKNEGLPVMRFDVEPNAYRSFLLGEPLTGFDATYDVKTFRSTDWQYKKQKLKTWRPRIAWSPSLSTGVATEYGIWDYSVALRTNLSVSLWSGAILNASLNDHIDYSSDFSRDFPGFAFGPFYPFRVRSGLDQLNIQQTLPLSAGVLNTFYFGQLRYDYRGFQNQLSWALGDRHQLDWRVGRFDHVDIESDRRSYHLASYRYYWPKYNVSVKATTGRFWGDDSGFRVDTRFMFGDHAVILRYKNTDAEFVGLQYVLPLTPRRDFNHRYVQVKGQAQWAYGIQTRINEDANTVSFVTADIPGFDQQNDALYLNYDRLSPAYVERNIERLRVK